MRVWVGIGLAAALVCLMGAAGVLEAAQARGGACGGSGEVERGLLDMRIESGGRERGFLLYVPGGYDGETPVPVVMSIHGLMSNPSQQRAFSRWDAIADAEPMLVVYPAGTGFPTRWNAGGAFGREDAEGESVMGVGEVVDDVGYFADLLDYLEARYCVDTARVYATGLSNGGGMSNRLACEMADRITAIGTVAGAYTEIPGGCNPSRAVPVIAFHGMVDPIVPYAGADDLGLPEIADWAASWAERNGCATGISATNSEIDAVTVTAYGECRDGADVVLYTIADGGHTWPGAPDLPEFLVGKTRHDFDATAMMWEFFQGNWTS